LLTASEILELKRDIVPMALQFSDQLDPATRERARAVLQSLYTEDVLSLQEWADGEYRSARQSWPPCRRPSEFTILLANGDVHPCNMIEYTHEPIMGNLFETPLSVLWCSPAWDKFRAHGFDKCRWCPIHLYLSVPL
jgi:radical SAM protein with 4Fe4S-binding SPASM domain